MPLATTLLPAQFDELINALARVPSLAALAETSAAPVWQAVLAARDYQGQTVSPSVQRRIFASGETVLREGEAGASACYIVLSGRAEAFVRQGAQQTGELLPGAIFGELALLAGGPQPTSVVVAEPNELVTLEIQRAALPALRSLPAFAEALDGAHHRHRHALLMQELTLLTRLDPESAAHLSESSRLHLFDQGHALFQQGEAQKRLYIIKQGWGAVTSGSDDQAGGAREQAFGAWQCFGLAGLKEDATWTESCALATSSEVLAIALSRLRKQPELLDDIAQALSKLAWAAPEAAPEWHAAQKQLIVTGLIDAQSLLLIDSRACVRCGNCAAACQHTHGATRLNLRGAKLALPALLNGPAALNKAAQQPWFQPAACVHCQTPACLPVCPTNAITRRPDGRVKIDEAKCIGCGECATSCPHSAITLVPRAGADTPRAVNCDLCADAPLNADKTKSHLHACAENCPTGALYRVAPAELAVVRAIPQHGQAVAAERAVRPTPRAVTFAHLAGIGFVAVSLGLALWAARRFGLHGVGLNLRWLTGFGGLLGLAVVMAYGWRRRRAHRRLGALRYWLIAHGYAACWMFGMWLIHHGTQRGSALTTALAIALVAAFFSGGCLSALYVWVPRWLTRLEPQPLLPADLDARRAALRGELAELLVQAEREGAGELRECALRLLRSRRWLWRQGFSGETLDAMVAAAQTEWMKSAAPAAEALPYWLRALALAATVRRLDALLWLHRFLRAWLWPHVITASLLAALLLVHLLQVLLFSVR